MYKHSWVFLMPLWVVAGGIALSPVLSSQAEVTQPISECDRLAASPLDPMKPLEIPGVQFNAISPEKAIVACEAEVVARPDNARIQYQYGRALDAGKRTLQAMEVYKKASALGSAAATGNVGAIFLHGGLGVEKNPTAALPWFERAAHDGLNAAKQTAARILDNGEGLPSPNPERAALYWRSLANAGDPEAAEKVGLAIKNKTVAALHNNEMVERLTMAADKKRVIAAYELAGTLSERNASPEDIQQGAKYALLAYRLALAAVLGSEEGWLPYQLASFQQYHRFIQAGAQNVMPIAEYNLALADFPPSSTVKFTVPIDCAGAKISFSVYIWQWTRSYPQTDSQAEWLRQVRGCTLPQDVVDSFRRVYSIARDNKVSFPDLAKYAFDPKNVPQAKQASRPTPPKTQEAAQPPATLSQSNTSLSSNEMLGLAAVTVGAFACWYWPDQCKELAWEAAKQGAKELVRKGSQ